jgi:hypothetical protein
MARVLIPQGLHHGLSHFRDELEGGRVPQERRAHLVHVVQTLPGHGRAELGHSCQLIRQRHVPGEEDPIASLAGRGEYLGNRRDRRGRVRQLAQDADLHIVDEQGQTRGVANLLQRLRNAQTERVLHPALLARGAG